ncbi:MAG: methionine gamma-lyase family protein, partial [Prevotella sp.]|nr:methionine gamma-lyase family protein [Prevotella sp.]
PRSSDKRGDIITAIKLGNEELLTSFCCGIQKGAPVDSFVTPEAWDMPGYSDKVIMAAGAFTNGASIELSADAPIREPFAVWLQGGITYTSGKLGIMLAAQEMLENGLISL